METKVIIDKYNTTKNTDKNESVKCGVKGRVRTREKERARERERKKAIGIHRTNFQCSIFHIIDTANL